MIREQREKPSRESERDGKTSAMTAMSIDCTAMSTSKKVWTQMRRDTRDRTNARFSRLLEDADLVMEALLNSVQRDGDKNKVTLARSAISLAVSKAKHELIEDHLDIHYNARRSGLDKCCCANCDSREVDQSVKRPRSFEVQLPADKKSRISG